VTMARLHQQPGMVARRTGKPMQMFRSSPLVKTS
jgi:hypothetical protein